MVGMRHRTASVCAIAVGVTFSGCVSAMTPLDPDIVANDCVYIDATWIDPEYDRILPIFPSNTVRWDDDALVICDAPHHDGDPVGLGGGFISEPTSPGHLPEEGHIPEGCATDYAFLVAPR